MQNQPNVIVAKSVSKAKEKSSNNNRKMWARICFYYPQYTLEEASKLSIRDIRLLLNTAKRIEAERNLNLVQIVASPHTKKGQGVKKLSNHYKKEIET